MKRNIEDKCLVDQLKGSECIYIAVWKKGEVFKLYVNDIVAVESGDKLEIKMEGHRIKKILNKQSDLKVYIKMLEYVSCFSGPEQNRYSAICIVML